VRQVSTGSHAALLEELAGGVTGREQGGQNGNDEEDLFEEIRQRSQASNVGCRLWRERLALLPSGKGFGRSIN